MTAISTTPGWTFTDLGSLGRWGSGGTPNRSTSAYYEGGDIPWLVIGDLNERVVFRAQNAITKLGLENSSAKLLPPGTLLVAMYGSIGKTSVTGVACATNQAIAYCIPYHGVNLRYLHRAVQLVKPALIAQGQGGAQQNISQGILKAQTIPLAPEREQERIADKLDNVLIRVDAVNTRLARVAPILKRFRQSVLAAATSGRLTEDWRAAGQTAPVWSQTTIGAIETDLRYGTSKKCSAEPVGSAVLRIPNVGSDGGPELNDLKYAEFDLAEQARLALQAGDLLIIRSNGSVDLVGKCCVVNEQATGMLFAGYLMRLRMDAARALPKFVYLALSSPSLRALIERTAKSTSGVNNINSEELRSLPLHLPPLEEQAEIVRRVETLFAFGDRLEARLQAAQTATERLTPALLAKAFRGELVTQDPNDEPASELLRRLKQEAPSTSAKRGRKSAV